MGISAIFVESTLKAAARNEYQQKWERMNDDKLWNAKVSTLTLCLLELCGKDPWTMDNATLMQDLSSLTEKEITSKLFNDWIAEPRVKKSLDALDINPDDHGRLFDILDSDNT